jgi:hypothetical protein
MYRAACFELGRVFVTRWRKRVSNMNASVFESFTGFSSTFSRD